MITNDHAHHQPKNIWEELPLEILHCVLEYLDPRNLVNLMCVSSNIRLLAIKFILMGVGEKEYINERLLMKIKPKYTRNLLIPNEFSMKSLNSFLDVLLGSEKTDNEDRQSFFLPRINLSIFEVPSSWSILKKLERVIEKYHVMEIVLHVSEKSDNVQRWLNDTLNKNSMKQLTRLTVMYPINSSFRYSSKGVELSIYKPLKVLNGYFINDEKSIENLCSHRELCNSLEVLTLSFCFEYNSSISTLFEKAFRAVLRSMPNLTTLYFDLPSSIYVFSIDDEMVHLLESTKLRVLRIDSPTAIFMQKATEKTFEKCLPLIEELYLKVNFNPNTLHFGYTSLPIFHNEAITVFFPPRPLKKLLYCQSVATEAAVMKIQQVETLIIHFESYNSFGNLPSLKAQRLILLGFNNDHLKDKYLTDMFPYTKEIICYDSNFKCSSLFNPQRETQNVLESIILQSCSLDITDGVSTLISSLSSFKAWRTGFYNQTSHHDLSILAIEKQQRLSTLKEKRRNKEMMGNTKLQTLVLKDCQSFYDVFLMELLSFNTPHLTKIQLENSYSISEDELEILFESVKAENLTIFQILGPKFNNDLIMKFLEMIHSLDSTTHEILNNDIHVAFNGPSITCELFERLSNEQLQNISVISLPDSTLDCEIFMAILERLNPIKLKKLQINFGKTGPTFDFFKHLKRFNMLEQVYISGTAQPASALERELFKTFLCNDLLRGMEKLTLFFFDCPDWCKFSINELEMLKQQLRSLSRSAPKLVLPFDNKSCNDTMDPRKKNRSNGSYCEIQ